MSSYQWSPLSSGSGGGVSSLNSLTGALTIAAGTGITVTPSGGDTLTIASTSAGDVTIGVPANGLSINGSQVLSLALSSAIATGALSNTDWNTFNNKQAAGNYITALTGDATASGPGSAALTLASVNSNIGSFGTASAVSTITVNGKGLVTAASDTPIQIAESQVTNLVTDLAGKQPTGNYITALTGDVTAAGPGSVAATLATVNADTGAFGSSTSIPTLTVNAKGLVTAASGNAVIAPAGTLTGTTLASNVVTSSLTAVGTIATGTWDATTIAVNKGGTGQTSYTDGQLLIGNSSGNTLTKATLTAGSGISITNGNGSITIDNTSTSFVAPTVQKFTSGSGTYTTPTSPRSPLYIRVRMVGGGGGGGGSGTGGGVAGTDGGNTTFGTTLLVAGGGATNNGAGGTASLGTGPIGTALPGAVGTAGPYPASYNLYIQGGCGAGTPLGGSTGAGTSAGVNAVANTGAGGSGSGTGNVAALFCGGGGSAGGYIDAIIASPSSTYSYAVGAGGSGGSAGASGFAGGNGGSGYIEVTEFYQ